MINKADITTIYISIPIFYPSGSLHLGHALTSTMADVTARWCKLLGYTVYFTAGVDEHGGKIAKKALSQQMSPVDYVAMMADHFKLFFKQLNINYDHFTRTTDQTHVNVVNDVITQFLKHDYFYKGIYEGNYCVTCEEFLVNQQINHYLPVKQCMTCLSDISWSTNVTYFWKLTKVMQTAISNLYQTDQLVTPSVINYLNKTFLEPGLNDLSITRTNLIWGIPFVANPQHMVYVWFDALLNYLTAVKYNTDQVFFDKHWQNEQTYVIQFVGKDIVRFHAIYWLMMLQQLHLKLPNKIITHGWITTNQVKMSKSVGNVIDPILLINKYSSDALRFYLVYKYHGINDFQYQHDDFVTIYNNCLANNYGNLFSRIFTMLSKYFDNIVPTFDINISSLINDLFSQQVLSTLTLFNVDNFLEYHFETFTIKPIITTMVMINKYIEDHQLWTLFKNPHHPQAIITINVLLWAFLQLTIALSPVLVDTCCIVFEKYQMCLADVIPWHLSIITSFDFSKWFWSKPFGKETKMLFPRINDNKQSHL